MTLKCGIVGLPNVGKSTLFNALSGVMAAEASNYPFCTIEPNVAYVNLPDERLDFIAQNEKTLVKIPTKVEFVDIAGLVKGASSGEGLGNKFLSHIKLVDAIAYVVRCFEDNDIIHVENSIDPARDANIVKTEIILSDIEIVNNAIIRAEKKAKNDVESAKFLSLLQEVLSLLNKSAFKEIHEFVILSENNNLISLNLLSAKKFFYICNCDIESTNIGNNYTKKMEEIASSEGVECIFISAQIESEIMTLQTEQEKIDFRKDINLHESGLSKVICSAYKILDFITFFSAGIKETRAWTIKKNTKAQIAAGEIHSDFIKGFIRAEVISYNDYKEHLTVDNAKKFGKMRVEGKDYIVQDGDIMHFRVGV